jgi:uncharacterized protein YjbI with pentapeptide repeats
MCDASLPPNLSWPTTEHLRSIRVKNLPDLPDLPFAAVLTRHEGDFGGGADYDTVLFEGQHFEDPRAANVRLLECAFRQVTITDGRMHRSSLRDVWARDVRLTGTNMAESHWQDVTVIGSSLAGTQIYGAALRRVTFSGCKLDSVNFRASRLTEVIFDSCVLRDVDFGGATLTRCTFPGSELTRAELSKVKMEATDLRWAQLGLIIDADSLRGAIMSSGQLAVVAPVLAETLGIVINDEPG